MFQVFETIFIKGVRMKKYALFCISLFCMSLFGSPEYDIVLLAPEGEEFTTESHWDCAVTINDAGYVAGSFRTEDGDLMPYVYHRDFGFKAFSLPGNSLLGEDHGVHSINSHGIAVGTYGTEEWDEIYDAKIFVYNSSSGECFDLCSEVGTDSLNNVSVDKVFITDENKVIFECTSDWWYSDDYDAASVVYIYDLNAKTVQLFSERGLVDVNLKGQMTGAEIQYDSLSPETSWFYDPESGLKNLGSLDPLDRSLVVPDVISPSGVVAGIGLDPFQEETGFVWSPDFGMRSFDISGTILAAVDDPGYMVEWPMILDVNDQGSVVGVAEVNGEDDYYDRSFIFSLENGVVDLGTLGGWMTLALGVNNQDQAVGISENKRGKDRAFIWDFESGIRELTTLIPKESGWQALEAAVEINNSGCIVGLGKYYGAYHHFLLIPKNSSN